jgi:hypothetical protein
MTQAAPPLRKFAGFVPPEKNFFQMPNAWIDICAEIRDISELKVIQYILRHTWGFHEYGICKTISVDEFMQGRRRQDGSRIDRGTGLSEQSVRNGIKQAIGDGYLVCEIDTSDAGRIKKSYTLKMRTAELEVQSLYPPQTLDPLNFIPQGTNLYTSDSQSLDPRVPEFIPRTEKDTIRKTLKKDTKERHEREVADATARAETYDTQMLHKVSADDDTEKHQTVKPSQKEVVQDASIPPDRPDSRPDVGDAHSPTHHGSEADTPKDTNKVAQPPAPRKPPTNVTVPKRPRQQPITMPISEDAKRILEDWQGLFKRAITINQKDIDAAELFVKVNPTREELKQERNWLFTTDDPKKPWYRKIGVCLADCEKNWGKWQSLQEAPKPGGKEPPNEHKASPKMYSGEWLKLPAEERWKIAQSEVGL